MKNRRNTSYLKPFETKKAARSWCEMKNQACRAAGNTRDIFAVVDGPDDDFAVVDLDTAVDLGGGYEVVS